MYKCGSQTLMPESYPLLGAPSSGCQKQTTEYHEAITWFQGPHSGQTWQTCRILYLYCLGSVHPPPLMMHSDSAHTNVSA